VRSRILLGASAWLLGAVSATAGSLYAVGQLGHGLLAQPGQQVSAAMVKSELARENADPPRPSPSPSAASTRSPSPSPSRTQSRIRVRHPSKPQPTAAASVLLSSSDGTAAAVCEKGGAYLVYWSPQQGYEADYVVRGPRPVASLVFRNSSGNGVVMRVSCRNGAPVEQLAPFQSDGGGGGDE
jgi:hypothetical protein